MIGKTDTPGVIAPPPLIYLAFLLAGFGIGRLIHEPSFGLAVDWRRGLAFVLVIGGLLLDGIAAGTFRRLGTPPEPWKPTTALATGGLYAVSRNPIYLGFAITYAGFAVAMDSPVALALLFPCLIVIDRFVIAREERYLAARFGAAYAAYKGKVRRWL
ncbi:isoprenylcysteine carboxylmethyltransferase family protein [Brevundimonas naejangsanensis]|uniref:Isoprenylcysteine carboxylmethyltransferase family protein n=1 Tax=Brevundimonas naejangsanensis TaxID=588932 RepID=A0A494RDE6_9CAUL|nr:isoprenylcysteine carboxylmethyltransferase family protein [Brevundimonas naejangsanensis]AYG94348.1 isoprenylcysteine carboxylmethyltransferase family protein [Brevundimonas naejangsanensis]